MTDSNICSFRNVIRAAGWISGTAAGIDELRRLQTGLSYFLYRFSFFVMLFLLPVGLGLSLDGIVQFLDILLDGCPETIFLFLVLASILSLGFLEGQ